MTFHPDNIFQYSVYFKKSAIFKLLLMLHPDNIFQYSVYFKKSAIFKLLLMLHPDNITQQTVLSKKTLYPKIQRYIRIVLLYRRSHLVHVARLGRSSSLEISVRSVH